MDKSTKIIPNFEDGILLPHNKKVYSKVVNALEKDNKVLFEQATGTGKSYLAVKYIKDFGQGKRVLFVSPTDVIKNYFVDTYKSVLGEKFDCQLDTCLYQGLNGIKNQEYDIIIFDEVHRMGAPIWGVNSKTLMSNNPNAKILGMTATLDRADGADIISYFNNKRPVSRITLIEALQRGILPNPDYTIAKVDFDDDKKYLEETVATLKEELKTATSEDKKQINEYLSKLTKAKRMIAEHDDVGDILADKIQNERLKKGKFIVFCPTGLEDEDSIESKKKMEKVIESSKGWFSKILDGKQPKIYQMHSNYGQKHNESERKKFEEDNSDNIKLLFAINMLNEGLHVGDIDGVLMFRSTSSKIVYLQQLGRALSAGNKGKQPVIFDFVANLTTAGVNDIKEVVNSSNHKERNTGNIIASEKEEKYYDFDFRLNVENLEQIEFIEDLKTNIYNFEHKFNFDFRDYFNRLVEYKKEKGNCLVPKSYMCKDRYKLGQKTSTLRRGNISLSEEYKAELNGIGFVWDVPKYEREEYLRRLKEYKEGHGDCLVPKNYICEDGYKLGMKTSNLRIVATSQSEEYKAELEEIGFVWDVPRYEKEEYIRRLKEYKEENGDCLVPYNYICEDGYKLGMKTSNLRSRNISISEEYKAELNEIGFVWKVENNVVAQEYIERLKEYKKENGDCLIPYNYICEDGYKLGAKTITIRARGIKLNNKEQEELNEIGFVWDTRRYEREEYLKRLKKYKEEKGNCLVPESYICKDGYKLGQKTKDLRRRAISISEENKAELNEIGFVWKVENNVAQEYIDRLKEYKEKHGDCLVPLSYICKDGYKLGPKTSGMRAGDIKLNDKEKEELNEIGFVWKVREVGKKGSAVRICIEKLKEYKEKHGDCLVPYNYVCEDGYKLGQRLTDLRRGQIVKNEEEEKELEEIGFDCSKAPKEQHRQENIREYIDRLKEYKKEYGDCLIPYNYICEDGYKLGQNTGIIRKKNTRNKLNAEERKELDEIGFVWKVREIKKESKVMPKTDLQEITKDAMSVLSGTEQRIIDLLKNDKINIEQTNQAETEKERKKVD